MGALDRFMAAAGALGVQPDVHRFPQGTKTAADAAAAIGCDLGQIVKSLVFTVDGRPILALTSGPNRADVARLAALAGGGTARRATPRGGPRGHRIRGRRHAPLRTPRSGARVRRPGPAPVRRGLGGGGDPDSVFPLAPDDIVRLSNGQVADLKESS